MKGGQHTEAPEGVSNVTGASLHFKVYTGVGIHVASCRYATDAARLMFSYGAGATVRYRHGIRVFIEGQDTARGIEEAGALIEKRVAELGSRQRGAA
jgi:hypothetical protein